MKNLYTPLDEKTVRSLKLGEIVNITGPVVTGRDEVHIRALEYLDEGKEVPVCLNEAALYHCGPIMKQNQDGTWSVVAAGPTTSARMNALEPRFIREFKIRAIIGKGGMSKEVAEAMKEVGCVYLAATGGVAVTYAEGLARVTGHDWADLGMPEALWQFQTKSLGPLIVAIDANGNSLYEAVKEKVAENLSKMQ
ncbi:fumarate hydratase beta subunit FumB [methanogenic archaeon ISO4-H5]|jgi:fumarate hydratase subunit beta|nr:fumarate hydratase beta subunit FumB [methanogenic archaeon ISO4-H5]